MGANISQLISYYTDEAHRLGNPPKPIHFNDVPPPIFTGHHGLTLVAHSLRRSGDTVVGGETVFGYRINRTKFDSGNLIAIRYCQNWDDFTAIENLLLRSYAPFPVDKFNETILPNILPFRSYFTSLTVYTKGGRLCFDIDDEYSVYDRPYNIVPSTLELPRVSISELVSPPAFGSNDVHMKIVHHKGELYMFKHHSSYPENHDISSCDRILQELECICKFSTQYVLQPSYIVTDDDPRGRFRGFLQPFLPAGSIANVISRLQNSPKPDPTTRPTRPARNRPPVTLSQMRISWPIKHRWCIDMAAGLLMLHKAKAFIGLLTPGNFLVDKAGGIKLIDLSPMKGCNLYSAPEMEGGVPLAGAGDIFSLGVIFWALAEENFEFDRPDNFSISWTNRSGSAPTWFHNLVDRCTQPDPTLRPSATVILTTLTMRAVSPSSK